MNRQCACGCGRSLAGKKSAAKYFDHTCQQRAYEARKGSPPKRAEATDPAPPAEDWGMRRAAAQAKMAELELEEKRGTLAPIDEWRAVFSRFSTGIRTRMLGVAAHAVQYLPSEWTREQKALVLEAVDRAVRELLEEAADAVAAGET